MKSKLRDHNILFYLKFPHKIVVIFENDSQVYSYIMYSIYWKRLTSFELNILKKLKTTHKVTKFCKS